MRAETRYTRTPDGVYLAYQAVGSGPDVAVDFHLFAGNVDLIWEEPDWGPLLGEVASFARLILHDRRGTGASSRNVEPPNLETRAADLLAVRDAVDSEAPVLAAAASTGAMHALFAATHPERTSALFWNYPRPRLAWDPDYPWGQQPEDFELAIVDGRKWVRPSTPGSSHSRGRPNGRESRTSSVTASSWTKSSCASTHGSIATPRARTWPRR